MTFSFRAIAVACASFILAPAASAQQRVIYDTKAGVAAFRSDAPLEDIRASSNKVAGKLDVTRRIFAFRVPMQSFNGFNSQLQRQHFNENYVESERFPEATFAGRIIEEVDLSRDGVYQVRAKGKLTIHGVTQERILPSKITIRGGSANVETSFEVPLADHNISIPSIVNRKIAEVIAVRFNANMSL